jgi:hypothetical protein
LRVAKNKATNPAGNSIKNQMYADCCSGSKKGKTKFAEISTIPAKIPMIVNGFLM